MALVLLLIAVAAGILLAGTYAGLETAVYRASRVRLQFLIEEGDSSAAQALDLVSQQDTVVTNTLIGHNAAVYAATFLLTAHYEGLHYPHAEFLATISLTPFCFILAEILPKRIAHFMPNDYVLTTSRIARWSMVIFLPLGWLLGGIGLSLQKLLKNMGYQSPDVSGRAGLLEYLEASVAEDILSQNQHQMLRRILDIQEMNVREVMIPRIAPISPQLILCFIAEKVLGLPRSY